MPTDHSGIAIGGNLDLPGRHWSGSAEPKWSKWLCPVHPLWWIVLKWGINPKNGQSARTWGYIRHMMGLIYATNEMVGWCWLLVEVDKLGMYELVIRTWIQHSSPTLNLSSLPQFFLALMAVISGSWLHMFPNLVAQICSKRPWRRAPTRESHQRVPAYRPQCHSDSPAPWALGMPWWPKVGMEVGVALGIADVVGWISPPSAMFVAWWFSPFSLELPELERSWPSLFGGSSCPGIRTEPNSVHLRWWSSVDGVAHKPQATLLIMAPSIKSY